MCADPSVLGRTFYLMGFVDGWSPMADARRQWPEPFDSDIGQRRGLAFQLVEGIALLSKVDWRAQGLADLGRPDGFHERQVDRWTAFLDRIKGRELPGLDEAAAWLRAHKPLDYIPGVMHGDYQFANVMFRHGAPARLAALVDWEMGTVGDPKLDLAGSSSPGRRTPAAATGRAAGYVDLTGMPSRAELLDHYAKVSGRQVDDIDYYCVLARWKLATVLEQTYQRAGTTAKGAAFGPLVLGLMRERGRSRRDDRLPLHGLMRAAVCRAYGPPESIDIVRRLSGTRPERRSCVRVRVRGRRGQLPRRAVHGEQVPDHRPGAVHARQRVRRGRAEAGGKATEFAAAPG